MKGTPMIRKKDCRRRHGGRKRRGHKDPGLETAGVFGGTAKGTVFWELKAGRQSGTEAKASPMPQVLFLTAAEVMAIDWSICCLFTLGRGWRWTWGAPRSAGSRACAGDPPVGWNAGGGREAGTHLEETVTHVHGKKISRGLRSHQSCAKEACKGS